MILLIPQSDLKNYKSRDLIPLQCEFCPTKFFKPKNLVLRALCGKRKVSTCSNECRKKLLVKSLKERYSNPIQNVNGKRIKIKKELVSKCGGKCAVCGYNKSFTSLTFHHVNPSEKCFSISDGINKRFSDDKLLSEIKKCMLLCSNCHCEYHDGLITLPI